MSHTKTQSVQSESLQKNSNVNFYDFQLNSLLREYRKNKFLNDFIETNEKTKDNYHSNKMLFLQDEYNLLKEEVKDIKPKKRIISIISLA